jgi:hypothetical protein
VVRVPPLSFARLADFGGVIERKDGPGLFTVVHVVHVLDISSLSKLHESSTVCRLRFEITTDSNLEQSCPCGKVPAGPHRGGDTLIQAAPSGRTAHLDRSVLQRRLAIH